MTAGGTARKSQKGWGIEKHGKCFSPALNTRKLTEMGHFLCFIMKKQRTGPRDTGRQLTRVAFPGGGSRLLQHKRQRHCPGSAFLGLWGQTPLTFSPGRALPDRASGQPPWVPAGSLPQQPPHTASLFPVASAFRNGLQDHLEESA